MARVRINSSVNASSLFETIVALMVIMIVFGIAMTIYVNVMKNSTSLSELNASLQLDRLARETKEKKSYFDETIENESTVIEKKIKKYNDKGGLLLLDIQAFDKTKKKLAERKEIIRDESNE